jgi:hypothetical protein
MSNEGDLEMMLSFITRMIDSMNHRLLNAAFFLRKPLGKWPVGDPEKWGNMF